ncbi:hypothetical protein ACVIKO_005787 [Rhizobium ruizarguesonis]
MLARPGISRRLRLLRFLKPWLAFLGKTRAAVYCAALFIVKAWRLLRQSPLQNGTGGCKVVSKSNYASRDKRADEGFRTTRTMMCTLSHAIAGSKIRSCAALAVIRFESLPFAERLQFYRPRGGSDNDVSNTSWSRTRTASSPSSRTPNSNQSIRILAVIWARGFLSRSRIRRTNS